MVMFVYLNFKSQKLKFREGSCIYIQIKAKKERSLGTQKLSHIILICYYRIEILPQ